MCTHMCLVGSDQGIFQTQGSNTHRLHWQAGSLTLSHLSHKWHLFLKNLVNILDLGSHMVSDKTTQLLPLLLKSCLVGFPGGSVVGNLPAQCRRHRRSRLDPWIGKIPWRRKCQPALVFLTEESHGGAWRATVHGVAKSQTQLKRLSTHVLQ